MNLARTQLLLVLSSDIFPERTRHDQKLKAFTTKLYTSNAMPDRLATSGRSTAKR